jgi:hypothetical protein
MVLAAEVNVHLVFYQLVTPKDNTGFYLPHKKAFVDIDMVRNILLHRQKE